MNRKQLTDTLLKNWPAKIICLTIAIFLYLFYQASLIEKKSFVVPLEIKEQGLVVHVGNVPSSVVINVRANENEIKGIFASDFSASVDLNSIVTSGDYKLPVEIKISDKLMGIDPLEVKLKEENLKVHAERLITSYVNVTPSIVGNVAEDYELVSVTMDPGTVCIQGPESLVNAVSEVTTGRVNVSNAKTNFSVETNYNDISSFIKIMDSSPCKATVIVEPKKIESVYSNIPVKVINIADNLELGEPLASFNITLQGAVPTIKKFNSTKNFVKLDVGNITEPGVYDIPVRYSLPLDLKIIDKTGDTMKVTLKFKEEDEIVPDNEIATDNEYHETDTTSDKRD